MWILVWALISAFILGIFLWNQSILFKRKITWKQFSKKNNLEYQAGKLMESPAVTGMLSDMRISLYEDLQKTEDITGRRFVTVISIDIGEGMPTGAVIATKELREFINSLNFKDAYIPNDNFRKEEYILRTKDAHKLKAYLNDERLKSLESLFVMKGSVSMFFFDEIEAVLYIETVDPLVKLEHLEKVMKKILVVAKTLQPQENEKLHLSDEEKKRMMEAFNKEPTSSDDKENKENKEN